MKPIMEHLQHSEKSAKTRCSIVIYYRFRWW